MKSSRTLHSLPGLRVAVALAIALWMLLLAPFALAQNTVTISPTSPSLDSAPDVYRSSSRIGRNAPSLQACIDAIKADAAPRGPGTYTYSCRPSITSITATVTAAALGTWSHVEAGTSDAPEFAPEAAVYPNAAGITFRRNGTLNRSDATGPAEGSVYQFYPPFVLAAGDVLRAEWTDKTGASRSAEHVVGGAAPTPPPPTPTGTASLTWDAAADASVTGYRVYFGTAPGIYSQAPGAGAAVNAPSYIVSGLAVGVRYYFAVTATASDGRESAYSNEVSKLIP